MSEEPIHSEEPTGDRPSRRSRLIMTTGILLAVAAVIVVVVLLVTGGGDETDDTSGPGTDIGITNITSPYDVHELPADTDLGDVEDATLVSISLVTTGGGAAYYGLSSDTEPAQALIKAVADAKALEAAEVSTTQAGAGGCSAGCLYSHVPLARQRHAHFSTSIPVRGSSRVTDKPGGWRATWPRS